MTGLGWVHLCRSSGSGGGWPRLRMLDTSLHTAAAVNEHSRSFTLPGATIALSEESLLNGGANTVSWHDIALGHLFTKIITENHTGLLQAL